MKTGSNPWSRRWTKREPDFVERSSREKKAMEALQKAQETFEQAQQEVVQAQMDLDKLMEEAPLPVVSVSTSQCKPGEKFWKL